MKRKLRNEDCVLTADCVRMMRQRMGRRGKGWNRKECLRSCAINKPKCCFYLLLFQFFSYIKATTRIYLRGLYRNYNTGLRNNCYIEVYINIKILILRRIIGSYLNNIHLLSYFTQFQFTYSTNRRTPTV
jgi:hypothetical protein